MSISSKQLIDAFFDQNNGRQKVTHQIESFNYFMSVVVPETLKNAGPLVITGSPDLNLTGKTRAAAGTAGTAIRVSIENNDEVAEAPKSRPREVTVTIEFANVQIRKPTIFENNGAVTPMYPNDARLRNLTYACSLYCDLLATFTMKEWPKSDSEGTGEPIVTTCQRTLPHVHVGRIPVMVGSETCLMSELPEKTPSEFGECSEDVGGYFIIQGGERVIISQERMAENYPFVFRQNKARKKDIEVIDVKSIGPDNEGAPKSFSVKIIRPARFSHGTTNSIVVTCPRIKAPVPLFIMMRALGIPDDRSIVELIIGSDSDAYTSILEESIRNAEGVTTTEGALEWIRLHLGNGSGSRETLTSNTLRPVRSSTPPPIRDILAEECLPHIGGASMEFEKACYIALITRRLLDVNAGILAPDDRDSYTNKKVELPGNLMGNLFRFLFCSKVVKDIKSTITKEIHNGFWKSSGKIMDILNQSNVYKILKSTTISVGMKSALATGNFASGKMGIKAGISQVLNRLTYLSGISHLRRLSTPIEKTGKLLAPRKLHNTQWGFVCPAETPEGHAVGVVKNLASLAVVSLPISAEPVVAFLYDVLKMSELNPKMIPIPAGTRVFVNGAWIGMLYMGSKETVAAITLLRAAKRCGRIHPHTGITFKFHQNEVWINTEGGRLMRPLLFAPAVREILKSKINPFSEREMTWNDLMKWKTLRGHSLIEFVDATETENLFIAMDLENLKLDHDYTHLEIHPATILGAMTSNIPFSDHNQSPRNVYQSAMGKQATGVYALNFRQRMDTMANLIWYSSVPLVNSFMGQYFSKESMSSGYNIIVAIMPYGGYNQEDSLMFNKASLDRGLFSTEFYRTYKDEEKKNQASGEEEKFCKPLPETTRLRQHANYNKLDPATGFVPVNTFVTHEDVLIGKVAPIRLRGVDGAAMAGLNHATLQGMSAVAAAQTVQNAGGKRYKDASKLMRTNESGFVDCIYRGRNGDGFSSVKIRIREHRRPEVGDKFSSRHGQKGTCGLILAPEDMPFTASGIIPDLIINPHCLAEDHEILTEHGFMNWSEVKEGYESGLLRVAGYDHETGHLVYEHPTDFILNERSERDMIEFSHSEEATNSNGVSLLVTTDHDMFARKGRNYGDGVKWDGVQKGSRGASHRVATDYEKIKAVDLLTADAIKFIGKARSGIITEDIKGPAFIESYKERNFTAFCELYGYWLGDGTLRFNGNSVEMSPVKVVDNEWLHERFAALELKEGIDFTYNVIGERSEARPVRYRFSIINREWFNFFCAEYGKKYAKYESSTTAPEVTSVTEPAYTGEPEKIKSAKWMAPWVWNLSANMARSILVGLRFADGCEKANRNIIWTSSSRFRDEIVRLAIHAGYSVNFKIQHNINDVCGHDKEGREIIARHVSWSISYTDTPRGSEPVLNVARDVKKTAYDGRTWCVTMPHGFIITRRVIREDAVVVQASRPIITGQCIPSRMTLAHIMETVVGRACCEGGFMGDGTPFNSKMTAEAVGEELTKRGLHHSSDEVLYCGYTGKQMPTNIFQGPCHYQRLKHMVADKIHSRATGPLVILTRQPAEGRARDGGLRIGEMERDVLIAHGVSLMLKERLLEMSDNFEVHVCKGCGMLGIANFARNIWCCRGCGNKTDFSKLRIPYAYKLFLQELESMSVTSRILTDSRLRQLTN
jgi:DNA-directed RNA polymerase II subunit RPB2